MSAAVDSVRTATNITTAATSYNVNTGTPASGDLAIVCCRFAAALASSASMTGYNHVGGGSTYPVFHDAADDWTDIFWRICDGTEGTTDVCTSPTSSKAAFIYYRITNHSADVNPPESHLSTGTMNTGTGANPDSNSITPSPGLGDYLIIAFAGMDGETQTFTAPTNYTNLIEANSGTGGAAATNCRIACASRQVTNMTSEDPGAFTANAPSNGWTCVAIAIKGPPPVTDRGRALPVDVYNPAQAQAILRNRGR